MEYLKLDRHGDEIKVETEITNPEGILIKFVRYLVRCKAIKLDVSSPIAFKSAVSTQGWLEREFRTKKLFDTVGVSILKHATLGGAKDDLVSVCLLCYCFAENTRTYF